MRTYSIDRIIAQWPMPSVSDTAGNTADDKPRNPFTGRLDIVALLEKTKEAGQWDANMTLAIAAMIGAKWTNEQILLSCKSYIREGHTLEEVREKVKYARGRFDKSDPNAAADEREWHDPQPLFASVTPKPYPMGALPAVIRDAVQETVGFSQFPPAMAACSALSVLSLAGQSLADVRRDEKLEGPTSLYLLVVAKSGERKTSADTFFMTTVYAFDKRMREENKSPLAKYRADVEIYEAKKQGLKARLSAAEKSGKSTIGAENDIRTLEFNAPKPLLFPQLIYTDATPEALGSGLSEKWPSAGVISAEAGIVFGSHGMGKDSVMRNLALLNTLWDGKPFKVDRTVAKSYILEGARLSMGLAVQAGTVRAFFENCKGLARDTGFAARFMMACRKSTQGTRFYTTPPSGWPCLAAFHRRIETMLCQIPQIEGNSLVLPMLEFSAKAKAQWIKFHDDVERELAPGGEMTETRDVASKAADNVARLAALFHLFEQGSPTGQIGSEHIVCLLQL